MDPQEMLENPGRSSASCGATIRSRLVMLFPAGLGTHRWRDPPLCLASPELLPTSGGAGSSCMVVARPLCPVARFDFPHVIGELLQRGTQPSLVVSVFLLFAFVHSRNLLHFGNERFDDSVDCLVDGHRLRSVATKKFRAQPGARLHAGARAGWSRQDNLLRGTWFAVAHPCVAAPHSTGSQDATWRNLCAAAALVGNTMPRFTPRKGMPSPSPIEGELRRRIHALIHDLVYIKH